MNRLPIGFLALPLLAFFIFACVTSSAAQPAQCEKKFTTLVFGDSIAWGQGLDDEDKFVNIVDRWLQTRVGATCIHMHGHAGATVDQPGQNNAILAKIRPEESLNTTPRDAESLLDDKFEMTGIGEVNISYPTIPEQVRRATEDP